MNLVLAKDDALDLLESIIAAFHSERPTVKAIHIEEAEFMLKRVARDLGYRVERLPAPSSTTGEAA